MQQMFRGFAKAASRWLGSLQRPFLRKRPAPLKLPELPPSRSFERLRRVVLNDEVSRTLFQEYAAHRASSRGEEEIGWVLLGLRETDKAQVLATFPAGSQRSAGVAHVEFNKIAQAVATRIVRQGDKRLRMLGIVHTHPGNMRQPSSGDFEGDSLWVSRLQGGTGVFGIGTADGRGTNGRQPLSHVQSVGELVLSWYALGEGERQYRPVDWEMTQGSDLALPLRSIWATIEVFAEPLERLCLQQAGISFELVQGELGTALAVSLKLAEPDSALRLVLEGQEAAFYVRHGQQLYAAQPPAGQLDRAVYLVLAELTAQR